MRYVKIIFVVCVLALVLDIGFEFAKTGIGNNEFNNAFTKAIAGDVRSQVHLGRLYAKGMFTEQSDKLAIYWFSAAKQKGSIMATEILCWDYKIGCEK